MTQASNQAKTQTATQTPSPQNPSDETRVRADDRAHVFHSWSAQAHIDPMPIASASGSHFTDYSGRRYLDFSSQLVNVNIGYQHPKLIAAIQEQAAKLCTIAPSFANDARSEAARLIAEIAPGDLNAVFFTNGGADANENAIRMARLHTGRHKVLAAYRSYHGATAGAIALTGDPRRWGAEPGILGTVVGTNGILVPPPGYLAGVRAICDEFAIMMIADEVMAGFGRAGEWFAIDHWGVEPDLIAFAKGVNSGYVPLGGVIISDAI